MISPPLAAGVGPEALWAGLADGDARPGGDRPRAGPARRREAVWRQPFDRITNGAPGIETLLASSTARASPGAGSPSSGWSTSCRRRRPACSGCARKGAIEAGLDADLVLFDPAARRTLRAPISTTPATTRRTRDSSSAGRSARPSSAGHSWSATGRSSGGGATVVSWSASSNPWSRPRVLRSARRRAPAQGWSSRR